MTFEELYHIDPRAAPELVGPATFQALQDALEDINAVLAGRPPKHAAVDTEQPLPTDGGTTFFRADGYRLTIVRSLNGLMRGKDYVHGYIYGPVLTFAPHVMVGNWPAVSLTSFYPAARLSELTASAA